MALVIFCCCLLRSSKEGSSGDSEIQPLVAEPHDEYQGNKGYISTAVAKPELLLYLLSKVFIYLAVTIPPLLVPSLLVQRGYSSNKAGYAMSILGQAIFCAHQFFLKIGPRFDKCHKPAQIFTRTEQTFVSARSSGIIF